jgi:hypothetical protein
MGTAHRRKHAALLEKSAAWFQQNNDDAEGRRPPLEGFRADEAIVIRGGGKLKEKG